MNHSLVVVLVLALAPASAWAQKTTFGGGSDTRDERVSTWIAYFDQQQRQFIGGLSVNYNKVQWRPDYRRDLETLLKGSIWRLGKHFWSTFDTNLPLGMAGTKVPPGYYYLGLQRSQDGSNWSLALIDAKSAQQQRLDAFNITDAPVQHSIPFRFEEASESVAELSLYFEVDGGVSSQGVAQGIHKDLTLRMEFGPYRLTIPVTVEAAL